MKMIRVTIFGPLVTILFIPGLLQAATFTDPQIPDGQTLHYRFETGEYSNKYLIDVKKKEEVDESVTRINTEYDDEGRKIYLIDDRGTRKSGYRFRHLSRLLVDQGGLVPLGFESTDRNQDGRLIRRFEAVFDDPTLEYPPDTYPVFCIVQVMRGTSFHEDDQVSFYIWIAPTEVFRMNFNVIKKETIEVPAGKIPCYVAEMKPDIRTILPIGSFLARLLSPFIPKYYFWFAVEDSHPLVKFHGVLGGAGAAPHTLELTRIGITPPEEEDKAEMPATSIPDEAVE